MKFSAIAKRSYVTVPRPLFIAPDCSPLPELLTEQPLHSREGQQQSTHAPF